MTGVKQTFWRGYHRDIFGIIWQAKTELFKRAQVKILRRLGHTARKAPVLTSFLVIALLASLPYLSGLVPPAQASPTPTFTFAASGDIGSLTSTTGGNNLARLSSSGMGFFLGLGDLSYNSSLTGDVWCSQFKAKYSNIEIIPGDHDTGGHNSTTFGETHSYERYVSNCPLTLGVPITCGPVAGACYAKEYYFDYPATNPLARFIFASPKIYNITGVCTQALDPYWPGCSSQTKNLPCTDQYGCWPYAKADIHYNWVSAAIDNARSLGIKWTIVGTHKVCISASDATCSVGNDFFNMLLSKKVDLIIQSHDNAYERSKQLALNGGSCTKIATNLDGYPIYNSACVVNSGSSGSYPAGAGTIVVIQGAWINDLYKVNSTSVGNGQTIAEAPYFAKLMGSNTAGAVLGFVQYSVLPPAPSYPSWNPNVRCSATLVTFAQATNGGPLTGSLWQTSLTSGGIPNKRALSPPCTTMNTQGQLVSTFVQINGVYINSTFSNFLDCSTTYDPVNGGVSYPDRNGDGNPDLYCDTTGPIFAQGSNAEDHYEFDQDWLAAGYCGAGVPPCDLSTVRQDLATGSISLDVQGFIFWDSIDTPGHWEIHPLTAWKLDGSPPPQPQQLSTSFVYSPQNPTAGSQVSFNAATSGGVPPYSYTWSFGDGSTGSGSSPTHIYSTKGTYSVRLTVKDSVFPSPNTANATQSLTVSPPLFTLAITGPSSGVEGAKINFTATASGGSSPYSFSWNFGDGTANLAGGSTNPNAQSHTYTKTGTFTVKVNPTDSTGKIATATSTVNISTTIPPLSVSLSGPGSGSLGSSLTISATATGGSTPYSFSWTAIGGSPSSGTGSSLSTTYSSPGTYTVSVTVTDANAKTATASTTISVSPPSQYTLSWQGFDWDGGGEETLTMNGLFLASLPTVDTLQNSNVYVSFSLNVTSFIVQGTNKLTFTHANWDCSVSDNVRNLQLTTGTTVVYTNSTVEPLSCTQSLAYAFAVAPPSSPPALAASFSYTPINPSTGQSVTLTATAAGGVGPYTFNWNFGDGSTGSGSAVTHTYGQGATFTVKVTAIDAAQNIATSTQQVTITSALTSTFTFSPSTITPGSPISFTATVSGGTSPYSYSWSFGDGSTGTGASVTHAYLSGGNFTVTLTVKDSGSPQQTAISQKLVKIPTSLATSFVFNPSSPEVGLQITFTGSASGGTAPYGFSWAFGDGGSSSANPAAHSYSSTGSFTVTLTVRDANGATATSSQTVPVASAPSVSFNYSPTTPEAGSPATFTSTTTGGVGPFTMIWFFGDGGTSNANPTTHTYATSGSFTANVTATDANGVKAISAKSVTVAPPLTVSFTETPSSPTTGQVVTFTATTAGGVGTVSYSWSFGDGATSTGNPITHTYTRPASFTVSVTATDSDGVAAVSSQTLTVRSPLTASFTYPPSNPVTGQTVTFTATASGGTSPYTFSWSFGDGLSATGASVTHSYTTNGTYTVTLTTNDSGERTATTSNTVSVGQQSQGYARVTSSDGKVFRLYSNGTSTLIGQPVTTQLRQISWKPDGSYALISGDSAVLLKYDGTSLTSIPTGVSTGLNFWTVSWKPDGPNALIGGSSGLLLKYNGVSVTAISDPNTQTLYAIGWNPTGNYALLVGKSGTMLTYDGTTPLPFTSGTAYDLDAVGWNPNGQYALIGGLNGVVLKFDGTTVTSISTNGLTGTNAIKSIAFNPSGTLALLVGDNGMVLTYNGSTLTLLTQVTFSWLHSVSWSASGTAYIVGNGGTMLTYSNGILTKQTNFTTSDLTAIAWKPT